MAASSRSTGARLWVAASAVSVVAMAASSILSLRSAVADGMPGWTVVLALATAVCAVALVMAVALAVFNARIRRRTHALRREFPAAWIVEVGNDPALSSALHALARQLESRRLRFPMRGSQTLVADAVALRLYDGWGTPRLRLAVPSETLERIEASSSPAGQYGLRTVPCATVKCRTAVELLGLPMHLLRFAHGWPLFLTERRTAAACEELRQAVGLAAAERLTPPR